jgi:predicted cupin superfamily sugar epimerase
MTLPDGTTATMMTAHLTPGFCFEKHQTLRKEDLLNINIEIEVIRKH